METNDIRVATFDCYGTLVDWEGGLGAFLYEMALKHEDQPDDNGRAMNERWEEIEFPISQGKYRPYKQVLAESLRLWMEERGYPWNETDGEGLVRAMRSWQPFPDTRPALSRARAAGLQLVILSNTDNDIVEHSLRHLEVPFDAAVQRSTTRSPSAGPGSTANRKSGKPAKSASNSARIASGPIASGKPVAWSTASGATISPSRSKSWGLTASANQRAATA